VQFGDQDEGLTKRKIEGHLQTALGSEKATHTM